MTGPAQVGLIRSGGFWAWLIRTVTQSDVNHCVFDMGDGRVLSAEPGGVRMRPITDFPQAVWSQFVMTPDQVNEAILFGRAQVGKPYGYLDDLAIGIGRIARKRTPHWLQRWLASLGQWQCAALSDACLRAADVPTFDDDVPDGAVFPGSFEHLFKRKGWWPERLALSVRTVSL